ncbi:hypothetical protein B0H11DRAFT_2054004 [Mycena galericulata]|nr:hypothetical protein B0H11DRAFT_2054004 [Mycena galericulata]
MRIVFNPALGETVHVSVSGTRRPTTELHFIAAFSAPADYEQVASGRVKLQVWSDIPASGRGSGDWGEAEFKPIFPSNDRAFSLLPPHEEEEIRTSLAVGFSVPVSGHRFSFTYRLVYPTGEIKWLGAYGHNGTLVLSRTNSPVVLGKGWVVEPVDNHSHRRDSDGSSAVEDFEVAKLSHPKDYTACPAEERLLYTKDSALVLLVPRPSPRPIVFPPTLIFGATPSGSLSFSSHGAVTTTGTGSLFFVACYADVDVEATVSRVLNHCSSPQFRVVSYTQGAIVVASSVDKYPAEVAVIPMAPSNFLTHSSLPLQSLSSLIPGGPRFCVFSSLRRYARIFSREPVDALGEDIDLTVGLSGGTFIVTPMESVNHGEEQWHIGIVSPYTHLPVATDGLPTPPPSPRLRPLTHRISEGAFQSPDPSFLSLPAAIPSNDRPASPSHLVVHGASGRRAGLLAAIRHLFIILFSWFARILGRRPGREVQPKRITDANERTPLLQEPTASMEERDLRTSSSEEIPADTASRISAQVGGGKTTILFQASSPAAPFTVPIQVNGRAVNLKVHRTDEDLFIVEFSSTGGKLKIGW